MGRSYSASGYINAVLRRSTKTFLVEGPTDKQTVHRLLLDPEPPADAIAVDHAGLLADAQLSGFGNKAKVVYVRELADRLRAQFPKLAQVFGTLIDREWDGLTIENGRLQQHWVAPIQTDSHFTTLGHSIENYQFDIECVLGYLRQRFPEQCTERFMRTCRDRFTAAIALAGSVSFFVRERACISKCGGLITCQHVIFHEGHYYLEPSLATAAGARQIDGAHVFCNTVNLAVSEYWAALSSENFAKWILHGHIGADVLWACIGQTALELQTPPAVSRQMAHGHQEERRLYFADWLSKAAQELKSPLDRSAAWLRT